MPICLVETDDSSFVQQYNISGKQLKAYSKLVQFFEMHYLQFCISDLPQCIADTNVPLKADHSVDVTEYRYR